MTSLTSGAAHFTGMSVLRLGLGVRRRPALRQVPLRPVFVQRARIPDLGGSDVELSSAQFDDIADPEIVVRQRQVRSDLCLLQQLPGEPMRSYAAVAVSEAASRRAG